MGSHLSGPQGQSLLTYSPSMVAPGAASGASAGLLSSTLTGPAFSILSGALAVNASTGVLTTTSTAPASGTISAHVRVQDSANANAEELTISVPVASVIITSTGLTDGSSNQLTDGSGTTLTAS